MPPKRSAQGNKVAVTSRTRKRNTRSLNPHNIVFKDDDQAKRYSKKWLSDVRYYFGTLKFRVFNQYHEFSIEDLGSILRLPIYWAKDVPDEFPVKQFWSDITGNPSYDSTISKPSGIQNPYFRYAQKGFSYTLFGKGNSTGVASQRELFFLYAIANNELVNATCHTPILSR
ncbi:hypothetical protein KIW84_031409 [Lathyrus oleraceus]|uniref:Arabidopsis retrotransposon Orf1 C-terminal domain-containing protein n=1 Tax=Pisum sativum TaxID=3888 RepID=A0A9D4XT05_PEA|nr:hypothetical protein KIW84_031409 [Pisum sativum]